MDLNVTNKSCSPVYNPVITGRSSPHVFCRDSPDLRALLSLKTSRKEKLSHWLARMLLCHAIIQNNTKQTNAAAFVPVWISTVIMDKKYNNYNTGKKYSIQTIIKIFG